MGKKGGDKGKVWERQGERLKKGKIGGETGREVETGEERGRIRKS